MNFTRFRIGYKILERARFPADKGADFRRGMMADLREASCGLAPGVCPPTSAPLPFVYTPSTDNRTWLLVGDALMASLVLIGDTAEHAACFIDALGRRARRGLGPERCRVILEQVDWLDPRDRLWTQFYFSKEERLRSRPVAFSERHVEERAALLRGRTRITLRFVTPLRLSTGSVLDALHRRLDAIERRFGGSGIDRPDGEVRVLEDRLHWRERGRRPAEASGEIALAGELDAWFPLLVAGQHLHIGHGAAMGFGGYELKP